MSVLKAIAGAARTPHAARRGELLFQLLALAGLFVAGGGIYAAWWMRAEDTAFFVGGVAGSLAFGALWLAGLSSLAELCSQHGRDLTAAELLASLRRGGPPPHPFTLYLRPFASTNAIQKDVLQPVMLGLATGLFIATSTRFELEQQIERATRKIGPLVGLGRPLEHVGAGRLQVGDHEWRDVIRLLSDNADLIILLPSTQPGTAWEVERILDTGLVSRTVIVDPPNPPKDKNNVWKQSEEWAHVRQAFAKRGYDMPEDSPVGQLLYFGDAKRPQAKARLDIDAEDSIAKFFKRIVKLRAKSERKKRKERGR
jgi:hypothetical protein